MTIQIWNEQIIFATKQKEICIDWKIKTWPTGHLSQGKILFIAPESYNVIVGPAFSMSL